MPLRGGSFGPLRRDRDGLLMGGRGALVWEAQGMQTWEAREGHFILPGVTSCIGSSGHFRMPIFGGSADPRFWPGYVTLSILGVRIWVVLGCHTSTPRPRPPISSPPRPALSGPPGPPYMTHHGHS